jgi:2-polyprenyl-3-methyl-5-hydroxy-6-metoxy-1,4-benzoquinol methylase
MPDRRGYHPGVFTVVECDECGLGYVNPRPTFPEMSKYYPEKYYEEGFMQNRAHHLRRYAREASYLRPIERKPGSKSLLDVGCANGDFPRFMRARGWHVEGVEVSTCSQPIADFKVYPQQLPDIPVHQPAYDAVTAWAVLEHVHNPMAYFRKASELLKAGGLFVFLVTNFNSPASRRLFLEDIPRHLYFFSEKTVRRYLEETGFALERAYFLGDIFEMPSRNWLHYYVKTKLQRQPFTYSDIPMARPEFFKHHNLKPGVLATLKYAVAQPLTALDRALLPVLTWIQILRKTYGISTYVAKRLGG